MTSKHHFNSRPSSPKDVREEDGEEQGEMLPFQTWHGSRTQKSTAVVTTCLRPSHYPASQNPSMDGGGAFQNLPIPKELLAVGSCWGIESHDFRVWSLVGFSCPSGWPHAHSHEAALVELRELSKQREEMNLGRGILGAHKGVVEGDREGYDALLYTCVKFSRIRKNYLCIFFFIKKAQRDGST